jgi:hypothetical protein
MNQVYPCMGLTTGAAQKAVLNTVTMGNAHIIVAHGTHNQSTAKHLELAIAENPDETNAAHLAVLNLWLDTVAHLTPAMISVIMFDYRIDDAQACSG